MKLTLDAPRILDFDIENRPLSYLGSDWTTGEVTAIGAGWVGGKNVRAWLLGRHTLEEMLEEFLEFYDRADMVTGHYIRGYDLPVLNGQLLERGMPPLDPKLTHDTKLDLVKTKYQSQSQENLAAMLHLKREKVDMTTADWREANRLTPKGLKLTRERVVGDVLQHIELRDRLMELGWLNPPKLWRPEQKSGRYVP